MTTIVPKTLIILWWKIFEFYTRPQSDQFYMINVLENQWLSVTAAVLT